MGLHHFGFRAHRIFNKDFRVGEVNRGSVVLVSLSEMGRSNPAGAVDTPFNGAATMKVYNVAPDNGVVHVRGEIDWDSDLDIRASVLVA